MTCLAEMVELTDKYELYFNTLLRIIERTQFSILFSQANSADSVLISPAYLIVFTDLLF